MDPPSTCRSSSKKTMASQHWLRILRLSGVVAPGWCYQRDRGVDATTSTKANSNNVVQFVEHDGARDDSAETPEDTVVNRSSGKIQTRRRSVHPFRPDAEVDLTPGAQEDSQMLRRSSSSTDPARTLSRETTEDVRAGLHSPSPSFSSSTQAARSLSFDTNKEDSDAAEEEVLTQHRPAPAIGIAADDDHLHHKSDEHTAMATESQTTNNSTLSTSAPPIGHSLDPDGRRARGADGRRARGAAAATTLYQQGVSCSGTIIGTTCSIANDSQDVTITCDPGEVLNPVVNCEMQFVVYSSNSPVCWSDCTKENCCMVAPTTTTTTTTVASTTTTTGRPTTRTTTTTTTNTSAGSSSTSTQMLIIAGVVVAVLVGIAGAVFAFSGSGGEGDGGGGRQEDAYGYGGGYSQGYNGGGYSQGYGGAGYGQEYGGEAGYY